MFKKIVKKKKKRKETVREVVCMIPELCSACVKMTYAFKVGDLSSFALTEVHGVSKMIMKNSVYQEALWKWNFFGCNIWKY